MKKLIALVLILLPSLCFSMYIPAGTKTITSATTANTIFKYYFGDTSGGAFNFTLPAASTKKGISIYVMNVTFAGSNNISVLRTGSDTINLATSDTITPGESKHYTSDGSNWLVMP